MTEEENNVIEVDFTQSDAPLAIEASGAMVRVYHVEETSLLGLEFDRPVQDFRLDMNEANKFVGALVATFIKMKEGK